MALRKRSVHDGTLHLTWSLPVEPDLAWIAFADAEILAQWLGRPIERDLRPGGRLVIEHGEGSFSRSDVLAVTLPHHLAMSWSFPDEPESQVSFTLHPSLSGTSLELVHDRLGELTASYVPGWITHLTFLEAAITEQPIPMENFWPLYSTFNALLSGGRR